MIRVPFFLLLGFRKGARQEKGQKGTTQEPRLTSPISQGHKRFNFQIATPNP